MKKLILGMAVTAAGLCVAGDYPFQLAEMTNVAIRAGFWYPRFETNDSVAAVLDGVLPKASNDVAIPRLTFWDHRGTDEWVACARP